MVLIPTLEQILRDWRCSFSYPYSKKSFEYEQVYHFIQYECSLSTHGCKIAELQKVSARSQPWIGPSFRLRVGVSLASARLIHSNRHSRTEAGISSSSSSPSSSDACGIPISSFIHSPRSINWHRWQQKGIQTPGRSSENFFWQVGQVKHKVDFIGFDPFHSSKSLPKKDLE